MNDKIIPLPQLTHITTDKNRCPNPQGVELMPVSGDCVLVAYHDVGVIPAGRFNRDPIPYDSFKISKAYYANRYDAWGFGFKGNFYVPWGLRDQFLLAMVEYAQQCGVITGFTLPGGVTKPAKAKANGTHKGNGATPPFDGGKVTKGKVTPVQAATVKAPRKRKGVTA